MNQPALRSRTSTRRLVRLAVAVIAVAGVAMAAGCSDNGEGSSADSDAPPASVPAGWITVTDDITGLSFALPDGVDRLTQAVQLPDGTASELMVYSHVDGDREVAVSVLPLDPDDFDLESAAIGAAEAVAGELVSVRPVDVAGRRGRDVEVSARRDGRQWLILQRIFLTDDALVQLQVSGPTDSRTELQSLHQQLLAGVGWPRAGG